MKTHLRKTIFPILIIIIGSFFHQAHCQSEITKSDLLIKVIAEIRKNPEFKDAPEANVLGYIASKSGMFIEYTQAARVPYAIELLALKNEVVMLLFEGMLNGADADVAYEYFRAIRLGSNKNPQLIKGFKFRQNQENFSRFKEKLVKALRDEKDSDKLVRWIDLVVLFDLKGNTWAKEVLKIALTGQTDFIRGSALSCLDLLLQKGNFDLDEVLENPGFEIREDPLKVVQRLKLHSNGQSSLFKTIFLGYQLYIGVQSRYTEGKDLAVQEIRNLPRKGLILQMMLTSSLKHATSPFYRVDAARLLCEDWTRPYIDPKTLEEDFNSELKRLSPSEVRTLIGIGVDPYNILEEFKSDPRIFDYTTLAQIILLPRFNFPEHVQKEFARLEGQARDRLDAYWEKYPGRKKEYEANFYKNVYRQALNLATEPRASMAYAHFRYLWRAVSASNVRFTEDQRTEFRALFFKTILNYEKEFLLDSDNPLEAFEEFRLKIGGDPILARFVRAEHWRMIHRVKEEVIELKTRSLQATLCASSMADL
ncbi:MAG: hypothetical protein ABIA04_01855 [Pseudomonadota bacterium]